MRKDFSYKKIDDQRTKVGLTATMVMVDGTLKQVQTQELKDRLRLNEIINPIVSALREVYGVQHSIGDTKVSSEGGRITDMVLDPSGPFRLVPEGDPHLTTKCFNLALALLKKELTKLGFVSNEEKDKVVKEVLENRFYEHVEDGNTDNLSKLLCLLLDESMQGYNAVELQQKEKKMKREGKQPHEMEDDEDVDDALALLKAFATSPFVKDRLAFLKDRDEKGSKK